MVGSATGPLLISQRLEAYVMLQSSPRLWVMEKAQSVIVRLLILSVNPS